MILIVLGNTGSDPIKIRMLPSQHSMLGHHRSASESVSVAGRSWLAFSGIRVFGSAIPSSTQLEKKNTKKPSRIGPPLTIFCIGYLSSWYYQGGFSERNALMYIIQYSGGYLFLYLSLSLSLSYSLSKHFRNRKRVMGKRHLIDSKGPGSYCTTNFSDFKWNSGLLGITQQTDEQSNWPNFISIWQILTRAIYDHI